MPSQIQTNFQFPPKFIVEKVGSYYHVKQHNTLRIVSYSDLDVAFNAEAFNGLTGARTWKESVLGKGNLTLAAPLTIPNYTDFEYEKITLANASNCHMLTNRDTAAAAVSIHGRHGILDFNGLNQGNADKYPINWVQTTNAVAGEQTLILEGLRVKNARRHAVYIQTTTASILTVPRITLCDFDSLDVESGGYAGLYMVGVADFKLLGTHLGCNTNLMALRMHACGSGNIDGLNTDGIVYLTETRQTHWTNFNIYAHVNADIFYLKGCRGNQFSTGVVWTSFSDAYVNNTGIALSDNAGVHSTDNAFSNIYLGRQVGTAGTNILKYGIEEEDANQDNNQYVNINGRDCSSAALLLKGAASKGQHQNILGTVTEA